MLDAICARNQYTTEPGRVIAELRGVAGGRTGILYESVGTWVGYFDSPETHTLCAAILEAFPDAEAWVGLGRSRRGRVHGTTGF